MQVWVGGGMRLNSSDASMCWERQVRLAVGGPGHLRYGVEEALRAALGPALRAVEFEPADGAARGPGA